MVTEVRQIPLYTLYSVKIRGVTGTRNWNRVNSEFSGTGTEKNDENSGSGSEAYPDNISEDIN